MTLFFLLLRVSPRAAVWHLAYASPAELYRMTEEIGRICFFLPQPGTQPTEIQPGKGVNYMTDSFRTAGPTQCPLGPERFHWVSVTYATYAYEQNMWTRYDKIWNARRRCNRFELLVCYACYALLLCPMLFVFPQCPPEGYSGKSSPSSRYACTYETYGYLVYLWYVFHRFPLSTRSTLTLEMSRK